MSPDQIAASLDELSRTVKGLQSTVQNFSHLCHQHEAFGQINTRLSSIETNVTSLVQTKGRSAIVEKIVLAILTTIIAGGAGYVGGRNATAAGSAHLTAPSIPTPGGAHQ